MLVYIIISSFTVAVINSTGAKKGESKIPYILEGIIKGPIFLPYLAWDMWRWKRGKKK